MKLVCRLKPDLGFSVCVVKLCRINMAAYKMGFHSCEHLYMCSSVSTSTSLESFMAVGFRWVRSELHTFAFL